MTTHTVIVMDTRGHGRSGYAGGALSFKMFADDVVALLDHLGLPKAAIVGWSDGGITGLCLAITKPDRVARLFAFGANYNPQGLKRASTAVFAAYKARCKAEYAKLSPEPKRWVQFTDALSAMWRREPDMPDQELRRITSATSIADGEHDEIIRREHTEKMVKLIAGSRLVLLPGVSHFAMIQNPPSFNTAVLEFLG